MELSGVSLVLLLWQYFALALKVLLQTYLVTLHCAELAGVCHVRRAVRSDLQRVHLNVLLALRTIQATMSVIIGKAIRVDRQAGVLYVLQPPKLAWVAWCLPVL